MQGSGAGEKHLYFSQQKTVDQKAHFRERRATKTLRWGLKMSFATPFLPSEIAIEALSHCDKGSIALPQRLYRVAIKVLSQCERGPIAGRKENSRSTSKAMKEINR
jgi:hypothetical protein